MLAVSLEVSPAPQTYFLKLLEELEDLYLSTYLPNLHRRGPAQPPSRERLPPNGPPASAVWSVGVASGVFLPSLMLKFYSFAFCHYKAAQVNSRISGNMTIYKELAVRFLQNCSTRYTSCIFAHKFFNSLDFPKVSYFRNINFIFWGSWVNDYPLIVFVF